MEVFENRLCATYDDLAGIISSDTIRQAVVRGRIEQLQRGGNGREALFAVDSLPEKYKKELYRRNPDLKAQAASKKFIDEITPDGFAMNFYAEFKIDGTRGLDYAKQQEYANNAAILEAFRVRLEKCISQRQRVGKLRTLKKKDFWANAAKALPRIADKFPHSLPENPRRLQEKFNEFFRGGKPNYEALISGKFQNANAAKVENDDQKATLIRLLSDPRNLNDKQIVMIYNAVGERLGWKTITERPVQELRKKYGLETSAGRLGESEFYNNRAMQVKRSRPTLPLYMWSLDGWDVELYFQKTGTDKRGYTVTTYSNRLTVVVVLDPCVNYPVGYAIGEQENAALIKEAVRNAVNHTAELFGQRYRANQIQSDHYALKAMFPVYSVAGDKVTPARVKNPKTKPVERYFRSLNEDYCQFLRNWSGFGITSDKKKQPNADALNAFRKQFPDEAGCRQQIEQIIASERAAKREDYLKLWAQVPEERRLPLSLEQYLLHFGAETGYKNALEGSGLNVKLLGARCSYDCFDLRFRQYAHVRWNVKYDPDNLNHVLAVNDDGTLRFLLESKYVQPMALVERTDGDGAQLARVQQFNAQLESHVKGQIELANKRVEQLFTHNPQLDNPLARAVLCDSRGQHKDQRNARRLAAANLKEIEVKIVEEVAPEPEKKKSIFNFY